MSRIKKKYVILDTTADGINGREVPAHYTPSNYTPVEAASEGTDKISAHLKGIDQALIDAGQVDFSFANNQSSAQDVTGVSVASYRAFSAIVAIEVDATVDQYQYLEFKGIYNGTSWDYSMSASLGPNIGVLLSVTNAGQVQYTSPNIGGFVSGTLKIKITSLS